MPKTIWDSIKKTIGEYENETIKINPSYAPKQRDVVDLVDYYWMNRFRDGDLDGTGFRKLFYNIILNPTEVASKMIDFDTKDVQIKAEDGQSYYPAWLMTKDFNVWAKDVKNKDKKTFGQILNQMVYGAPKYGHLLVKKAKNTIHLVALQNVINKQTARCLLESDTLGEKHEYTPYQLRQQGWDNVEAVIRNHLKNGKIIVYEMHGEVENSQYNYFIIPEDADNNEVLFCDKIDRDDLYKEHKWEEIPGRALGRGQPERLFEGQIAKNQNENFLRTGLRWSSKHIFQTRDDTMAKNLISQIENGDVLTVLSEITAVPVEERNLPAYNIADQKWDRNAADLTFAYNQVRGENPPSGTPLGTSVLQTNMSSQFYDLKREDLGMFIKDILYDWIIPSFKKDKGKKHSLMLGEFDEDELDKMRNLILTNRSNKSILKYITKNLKLPSSQEAEMIKALEKEQISKAKEIEVPDNYYDDLKYKIKIVLTNEQIDVASRLTTLQTILQIIGSNPTILKDPRTKKIFYKALDLAGFSPVDFGLDEPPSAEEMMGQMSNQQAQIGGSIARPVNQSIPQRTLTQSTL